MKKKIITLALVAVMTFASSITAFAATSPSGSVYYNDGTVSVESETEGIFVDAVTAADFTEAQAASYESAVDVLNQVARNNNVTVLGTVYVDITSATGAWDTSAIRVSVAGLGVKKGEFVIVQHLLADGTWKTETASVVADDVVEITGVTSFSPFIIAKVAGNPAAAASVAADANNASAAAKSPKTGVSVDVVLAALADLF